METLEYEIIINASVQKVWDLLWNEETYTKWTHFFMPGSQFKTDWEINGKTFFVNETGDGMTSTILSLDQPYSVVFSHLGMIRDGVEDTKSKEVIEWSGAQEKYFLREIDGYTTELRAIVHSSKDMEDMMNKGFNQGFELLKNLAES